jgi:hypothetical protein
VICYLGQSCIDAFQYFCDDIEDNGYEQLTYHEKKHDVEVVKETRVIIYALYSAWQLGFLRVYEGH